MAWSLKNLARMLAVVLVLLTSACMPAHLQKYRTNQAHANTAVPGSDIDSGLTDTAATRPARTASTASPAPAARIYAIDEQTFRFQIGEKDVWESAVGVLLKNYNLNIVDRQNGIITTEWDTFYLNNAVYRNKVSLRIKKSSFSSLDIMLHNSVEKLQENAGAVGAIWLPTDDGGSELQRIVQNIAISLNEAPPAFPANVAGEADGSIQKM